MKSAIVEYDPKKQLEQVVRYYLESNPIEKRNGISNELEVRFGTNPRKPITKIGYENIVKQLYAVGFKTENPQGINMLRIIPERASLMNGGAEENEKSSFRNTGYNSRTIMSDIRVELNGSDTIQNYCKTNDLSSILSSPMMRDYKVGFLKKMNPIIKEKLSDNERILPVDFKDFHFRVSYQLEQELNVKSDSVKLLLKNWMISKKIFRYINRVRLSHPTLPIFADISIVKGNKKTSDGKDGDKRKISVPYKTLQEAGVFESPESYEIELEVDNTRIGLTTAYNTGFALIDLIKRGVRIILSGLQGTAYPIAYGEQEQVLLTYMQLLYGEEYKERKITPRDFIGPQTNTLQNINAQEITENTKSPNIRKNYCVTDKADGDRKLLFINYTGLIYLIDTNMNVIFTGMKTMKKELQNSLLDGEHIKYDKMGKYINLYAAFDLYYFNNKSVRELAFLDTEDDIAEMREQLKHKKTAEDIGNESLKVDNRNYRLHLLREVIKYMNPQLISDDGEKRSGAVSKNTQSCNFIIKCKKFYSEKTVSGTIFDCCSIILTGINDGSYEYNTDGLIFTPCYAGVGATTTGVSGKLRKSAWELSFKWKPMSANTIDFLVKIKKNDKGKNEIHTIFEEGTNLAGDSELQKYMIIELLCGFDEKRHGFINPAEDVIQNKIFKVNNDNSDEVESSYRPIRFVPTEPYDVNAGYANIPLHLDVNSNNSYIMKTEEGEYFEENMIVEFKYDITLSAGWQWIPLRVRNDKTIEFKATKSNFGNDYSVADNNWKSIHNPIHETMITTGDGFDDGEKAGEEDNSGGGEDVYYNRKITNILGASGESGSNTIAMRNFHNLYIKKKLILGVAFVGDTLIDYSVGKGGDLSKWISANLSFVFGIDVSKDNIHNRLDGAYSRYLKESLKYNKIPRALFVLGNSSLNIRNGDALTTDKDKMITRAVFGSGTKDKSSLGEGVYINYGIATNGFNISSCQFSLHYFFEGLVSLHGFMRNLSECTRIGGYFIGTCFDGREVFNLLKRKSYGESSVIMRGDTKILELTKMYHESGFPDDENSIGYGINVFQESINKVFREYLVNFQFLKKIMDNYGFVLIINKDAKEMGFPNSTGLFQEMFLQLEDEIKRGEKNEYGLAFRMSEEEKKISFLNRYFIFKKMREVNTEKVYTASTSYQKSIDKLAETYDEDYDAVKFSNKLIKEEKELNKVIKTAVDKEFDSVKITEKKVKTQSRKLKVKYIILDEE